MNRPRTRLTAALVGIGLVLTLPTAALAADRTRTPTAERTPVAERPRDIESIKARCQEAIDQRLRALRAAAERLESARHLTDEHEAALAGINADTSAGLTALAAEIAADTETEDLRAHCRSIFEDHRVFALVLPRMRLVVGADTAVAVAARLEEAADRIEQAIIDAEAGGEDMGDARADLDALRAATASAQDKATSVPEDTLGLTPADWNADHEVLTPAHQALRSARADLETARELARGLVALLKA